MTKPVYLAHAILFNLLAFHALVAADYNPLDVSTKEIAFKDFTVHDSTRQRDIPVRVYLPGGKADAPDKPAPVILFSHGLGGNREGSPFLGKHWAARGYVVVHFQHAGSDDAVWKDVPMLQRMAALKAAASVKNWTDRVKDVPAVLDQLTQWNAAPSHELSNRVDLQRIGMSGHSFGGATTQAVAGQSFGLLSQGIHEPRIKAALVLSPSAPERGDIKAAFSKVSIPWFIMTGTHDTAAVGNQTVESRLKVFPALPANNKYHLVLDKAEHSAFSDRPLPGDKEKRNPNHHRVILALSTAFWDAYLRDDAAAKTWLNGEAPRAILEPADVWEKK